MTDSTPSIGLCAQLACIWEATARKPGNVHRYRDFEDTHYTDFLASASAIAPVLERAPNQSLGRTILEGVRATKAVSTTNTNLGILLLLAPLASIRDSSRSLGESLPAILDSATAKDSSDVFEAIRLANPGGLGDSPEQDVANTPTLPLRQIMTLAAERDHIARQYANVFQDVSDLAIPALLRWLDKTGQLEFAIVGCALTILAEIGDTLIERKCGKPIMDDARLRAEAVLDSGWPSAEGKLRFDEYDSWLRADGHRRNPGTTADLVTACLFWLLREGRITLPTPYSWCDQ